VPSPKKTILMIALDFPPCRSAGVQRTLKFAEYLIEFGWQPIILSVTESAHKVVDHTQKIPSPIKVYRSHALDSSRDLAIKGKHFAWSKVPDKWWTWAISAIPLGKKLIDKYKPDVIWSTYPVSTAHFIAYRLNQYSKLPWVADYRDPLGCWYDTLDRKYSAIAKWIEKKTIEHSSKVIFTTEPAAQLYRQFYSFERLDKFQVIENGFDEINFLDLKRSKRLNSKFTLLHSGSIYENGRDPSKLFLAVAELAKEKVICSDNFELIFRGANRERYKSQLTALDIVSLIEFRDSIAFKESLSELFSADALLIIQGELFQYQIPGKVYEYLYCQKPILALTTRDGATGTLLKKVPNAFLANDVEKLKEAIVSMMKQTNDKLNIEREIFSYSRKVKAHQLNTLLTNVI